MLEDMDLKIPFWINTIMLLECSILFYFDFYKESLQRIYAKLIEDGKQRSHIFFRIQDMLIKNLAMQGNATFNNVCRFLMAIRAQTFRKEIEAMEVDVCKVEEGNSDQFLPTHLPKISEVSEENSSNDEMLKIELPEKMKGLAIVSNNDDGIKFENVTAESADADLGESGGV